MINFMPHQNDALNKTQGKNHVAYYLDMGLGKTFIGAEKMYLLNNKVNLLVCQKSKINDWVDHFTKHYETQENMMIYDCTKWKKSDWKTISKDPNFDNDWHNASTYVLVINYELVFRRPELLSLKDFTLMLDESSLIQNEKAKRTKFIMKLQPESVILLSGTPTAGKYEKLWSQCRLLGWNITKKTFWSSYVCTEWIDLGGFYQEVVTGYKNVDHLKKKLTEYGCIFMKSDEVLTLPEQIESKMYFNKTKEYNYFEKNSYVDLSEYQKVTLQDMTDFKGYAGNLSLELVGDNNLTKMLYSRQLCGQYHNEKLQGLHDLVQSTEDRVIIFYNFTEELQRMEHALIDIERPYSYCNGQVKDLSAYDNESNSITFVQYQAGAMGLNLQMANKIIYFTLPLGKGSCDLWEQSKKRIHRIGQKKSCFYYYLLVKGSIEERNLKSLQQGKDLTDYLFE